jgi:LPS O-antigen subunit length determinant protein (WzzB/FepE family)
MMGSVFKFICFAHNTSVLASSKFTPFEIVYGRKPNSINDNLFENLEKLDISIDDYVAKLVKQMELVKKSVKVNLEKSREEQKKYYDQKEENLELKVGDSVLLFDPKVDKSKKLLSRRWKGPFKKC